MKAIQFSFLLILAAMLAGCASAEKITTDPEHGDNWRAVHILGYETDAEIEKLEKTIPPLAAMGVNTIVFEVDYNIAFEGFFSLQ